MSSSTQLSSSTEQQYDDSSSSSSEATTTTPTSSASSSSSFLRTSLSYEDHTWILLAFAMTVCVVIVVFIGWSIMFRNNRRRIRSPSGDHRQQQSEDGGTQALGIDGYPIPSATTSMMSYISTKNINDLKTILRNAFRRNNTQRIISTGNDDDKNNKVNTNDDNNDVDDDTVSIPLGNDDEDRNDVVTGSNDTESGVVTDGLGDDNDRKDEREENENPKTTKTTATTTTATTSGLSSSSSSSMICLPIQDLPSTTSSCAICLDEFDVGDVVVVSEDEECPHMYHLDCAVEYLAVRWRSQQKQQFMSSLFPSPLPSLLRPRESTTVTSSASSSRSRFPSIAAANAVLTPQASTVSSISTTTQATSSSSNTANRKASLSVTNPCPYCRRPFCTVTMEDALAAIGDSTRVTITNNTTTTTPIVN